MVNQGSKIDMPPKGCSIAFLAFLLKLRASLASQVVKTPLTMQETWVQSLVWEEPLEKEKATHSSILAWRISWTMGSQRVGHD